MAYPVLIRLTYKGQSSPGPFLGFGETGLWEGHEFSHEVTGVLTNNGWDVQWQRAHRPVRFVMELGRYAPECYGAITRGQALDKIEFLWPRYKETSNREQIYFKTILHPVELESVRLLVPNVKDPRYERYNHLVEIRARYRWIEWEYCDGKLWHKDEWNHFLIDSFETGSESERKELEKTLAEDAVTDDLEEPIDRARLISPAFEHWDEGLKEWLPEAVRDGDRIILLAQAEGFRSGDAVYFDIFDTSGPRHFCLASVQGAIQGDTVEAEWVVDLSRAQTSEPQLAFEVTGKGARTTKCPIRIAQLRIWVIIDCHMHVNSGHCSPVPLSRSKIPIPLVNRIISQKGMDTVGDLFLGDFGKIQKQSTEKIAQLSLEASKEILSSPKLPGFSDQEKPRRLLVCLPMNMDYAHYRGYEGIPIYENVDGKVCWWDEGKKRHRKVRSTDFDAWESHSRQMEKTASAFIQSGGELVSFYHYDPRAHLKNWREPFEKNLVHTADPSGFPSNLPAIGIKMYTALGYRPMDNRLDFPWHEYYALCTQHKIPIICHGSPGGMVTHDIHRYFENEYPQSDVTDAHKEDWFFREFVSPDAWEEVLREFPSLVLCLAHFGGDKFWDREVNPNIDYYWRSLHDRDPENWISGLLHLMVEYPHFYIDLSYFLFKPGMNELFKKALEFNPVIKERVLFGTDWWMFTLERGYRTERSYLNYVEKMYDEILGMNEHAFLERIGLRSSGELLGYFTVLNPLKFLRLNEVAPKISDAFYRDKPARMRNKSFLLNDWIDQVPENIEELYR